MKFSQHVRTIIMMITVLPKKQKWRQLAKKPIKQVKKRVKRKEEGSKEACSKKLTKRAKRKVGV